MYLFCVSVANIPCSNILQGDVVTLALLAHEALSDCRGVAKFVFTTLMLCLCCNSHLLELPLPQLSEYYSS